MKLLFREKRVTAGNTVADTILLTTVRIEEEGQIL